MSSTSWRKRFAIVRNRLYLYPEPEPMAHGRLFWLALGMVTVVVLLFCGYFITYMLAQHDAFLTNAEDLGIMDQAIWNTLHGNMLHMTICNIINDTNCVTPAGYTRFAIHFEPILFPVSWIYFFWPSPKTLLVIQTLVVGLGAYPAFWLARLRLRSELAGVAIAILYLLYPVLHQAVVYDFHAVTFTATFLMFTLYFMYTRRTIWMFVFAVLAMACKEEMPLVIMMFGFWSILFQRRWKSGLGLMVLAGGWFILGFYYIIPHFSPTGQHLLISRYDGVKNLLKQHGIVQLLRHPGLFLQPYVFESEHSSYLHTLFAPAGYIPLPGSLPDFYLLWFAPWIVILALPSIATNLLSSSENQYSGLFHYNAEIVPVVMFATIEAIVLIIWVSQFLLKRLSDWRKKNEHVASEPALPRRSLEKGRMLQTALLVALLSFSLFSAARFDFSFHGQLPFSYGYQWPQETTHTALAQKFIAMIPPDASVSAQTKLVPHISQRKTIYMFPYGVDHAESDYIFLDVTGDVYPYFGSTNYIREVKTILRGGQYGVVAAQDGYLLLKRGLPAPTLAPYTPIVPNQYFDPTYDDKLAFTLPTSFCSYVTDVPKSLPNPLQADFTSSDGGSISLLGSTVGAPPIFSLTSGYMAVTTYWRVNSPITEAQQVLLFMQASDGQEHFVTTDFPDVYWCQSNTWTPGTVIKVTSRIFGIQGTKIPTGVAHLSVALIPLIQPSDKIMETKARLSVRVVHASNGVSKEDRAVALKALTISD
jgi:uncharacterized membrane protein